MAGYWLKKWQDPNTSAAEKSRLDMQFGFSKKYGAQTQESTDPYRALPGVGPGTEYENFKDRLPINQSPPSAATPPAATTPPATTPATKSLVSIMSDTSLSFFWRANSKHTPERSLSPQGLPASTPRHAAVSLASSTWIRRLDGGIPLLRII